MAARTNNRWNISQHKRGGDVYCSLLKIEERLRFNHRNLVGVSGESVNVKLAASCLKVDITEGLEAADFETGKLDKYAATPCEAFKVGVALPIEVRTHLLDLKISHITYSTTEGAFVRARTVELEALNKPSFGQHLGRNAYDLAETDAVGKYADNVGAAGYPD